MARQRPGPRVMSMTDPVLAMAEGWARHVAGYKRVAYADNGILKDNWQPWLFCHTGKDVLVCEPWWALKMSHKKKKGFTRAAERLAGMLQLSGLGEIERDVQIELWDLDGDADEALLAKLTAASGVELIHISPEDVRARREALIESITAEHAGDHNPLVASLAYLTS